MKKYKMRIKQNTSLLLGAAALTACSGTNNKNAPEEQNPNIVIILADDMGYSDLGCYGSEISTPHADSLAYNGLRMTRFYNTSRSCPSRAALLTGLYQHEAGVGFMTNNFKIPGYRGFLNSQCVTMAEVLKEKGYSTYLSGKWHLGNDSLNWPLRRGFERFYGFPAGGGVYFKPFRKDRNLYLNDSLIEGNEDFYSTDNFSEYASKFVAEHEGKSNPFFLYLPYIAPHFPLQAHPEDIKKYRGKYMDGFQKIRQQRFERMKQMGILPADSRLSASDSLVKSWDKLTEAEKDTFDLKMAVYAAQVESMDRGIGQLINTLKETGQFENTVIIFLSDNGGTHETLGDKDNSNEVPIGSPTSWVSLSRSWANVSNTPFRMYKHWVHEGGISTFFIVHYPKKIKQARIDTNLAHIIDLMPTCLELADAEYPKQYKGNTLKPLRGHSLVSVFEGNADEELNNRPLFWEHMGNRAVRYNNWKLVMDNNKKKWELYDIKASRIETQDVSEEYDSVAKKLKGMYFDWAKQVGVVNNWDSLYKAYR